MLTGQFTSVGLAFTRNVPWLERFPREVGGTDRHREINMNVSGELQKKAVPLAVWRDG